MFFPKRRFQQEPRGDTFKKTFFNENVVGYRVRCLSTLWLRHGDSSGTQQNRNVSRLKTSLDG
jgi:hypothetical protein